MLMEQGLELTAYRIHNYPSMQIVPAPVAREWMDLTHDRFAYRCLPLLIANQSGWLLLNTHKLRAVWNGKPDPDSVTIIPKKGPSNAPCPAVSHFGHGILTFNLNYLFRTPPGYNLWARGPANFFKDGISPLEGLVETDWSPATFTMNWKMTSVDMPVDFEIGEPVCMIVPVKRGEVEQFRPAIKEIASNPQIKQAYEEWSASRSKFLNQLKSAGSAATEEKWQRDYVQGEVSGVKAPQHQVKLNVREFESES
jgi:hypothetical protein